MSNKSYTNTFTVAQSPEQVCAAVTNPRAWWGEGIIGETAKLGGEFVYRNGNMHTSTQKISEFLVNKKVVWKISKSQLNFVANKSIWDGTEVIFDIAKRGDKTELKFTHVGLVPQVECFKACSSGWDFYLNESLKPLIETGKGQADPKSKAAA
jgi:Activator of Hsp90 ATPase homolog 1-like protein